MSQPDFSLRYRYYALVVLTGVNIFSYMDRRLIAVLIEPIKDELQVSDFLMGAIVGLAFASTYVVFGFPIARIADRGIRVKLITVSVTFWSLLTMISGTVTNALQMFVARLGVGAGEAGGQPPAQSLVAEYFPADRRTFALGLYSAGAYIGIAAGASLGGYLGDVYSWRTAFFVVGGLGLPFALLFGLTVREMPLRSQPPEEASRNIFGAVMVLFRRPAYRNVMIANAIMNFSSTGAQTFHPSFFLRTHGLSLSEAGGVEAAMSLLPVAVILFMSYLTGRLFRRDPMWLIWIPMATASASIPFFLGMYLAPTWQTSVGSYAIAQLLLGVFNGLFLAIMQSLVFSHERALAAAMLMFFAVLIGQGMGPPLVGLLSDLFRPEFGEASLKWALVCSKAIPFWAIFHLWLVSRTYRNELVGEGAPAPATR